ncbi:MAG TPA: DedA family protein [Solirubrobacteraceae bacterium]|jgi:membrane protein DedA with SNARE-associated domain|nr:DedA family protein [Solirubrobacteraceae bacterium]
MTSLISSFGAWGVFALMVPESACVPVPSEVTLLFSGFAVHQGWMSLPLAVLAATGGNLLGSLLAYALGASGLLERVPGGSVAIARSRGLLARHGERAVFIARLLPLARTFISLPAGARRVRLLPFVLLTTAGCALWALAFVLAGMWLGASWSGVGAVVGRVLLGVGLVILLLAARRVARAG